MPVPDPSCLYFVSCKRCSTIETLTALLLQDAHKLPNSNAQYQYTTDTAGLQSNLEATDLAELMDMVCFMSQQPSALPAFLVVAQGPLRRESMCRRLNWPAGTSQRKEAASSSYRTARYRQRTRSARWQNGGQLRSATHTGKQQPTAPLRLPGDYQGEAMKTAFTQAIALQAQGPAAASLDAGHDG